MECAVVGVDPTASDADADGFGYGPPELFALCLDLLVGLCGERPHALRFADREVGRPGFLVDAVPLNGPRVGGRTGSLGLLGRGLRHRSRFGRQVIEQARRHVIGRSRLGEQGGPVGGAGGYPRFVRYPIRGGVARERGRKTSLFSSLFYSLFFSMFGVKIFKGGG